jgi:hypothetical protein
MLPLSDIKSVLGTQNGFPDVGSADFDVLESDYTFFSSEIRNSHFHEDVVRGPFSRQLDQMPNLMMDEIRNSCDHLLGSEPGEQREILLFNCMRQIVARTASRVFVGKTLCMWGRSACMHLHKHGNVFVHDP